MAATGDSGVTSLQDDLGTELLMKEDEFTKNPHSIGVGGFAKVYSANHKTKGPVALKVALSRAKENEQSLKSEIHTLKDLDHKNVIRLIGYFYNSIGRIVIVLELAKWVLVNEWTTEEQERGAPVDNAVRILYEIADGMNYLNCLEPAPLLHMDLKSKNVLVMEDGTAKISDFGLSERRMYSDTSTKELSLKGGVIPFGSVQYVPPERLIIANSESGREQDVNPGRRHDVYSYAIVMWEVLSYGESPYEGKSVAEIKALVVAGGRPNLEKLHPDTPDGLKDLMESCWHADFRERKRFDVILSKIELVLDNLKQSGQEAAEIVGDATTESFGEASESLHYDAVDSRGSMGQNAAMEASSDATGDSRALDEVDAVPVGSMRQMSITGPEPSSELPASGAEEEQPIDVEASFTMGPRYAQEEGGVIAAQASSDTVLGQLLYSDSLCIVGETGAGKTSIVRALKNELGSAADAQSRDIITRYELKLDDYEINVNDFRGVEMCRALLPLVSPRNALFILVYNMSEPWEKQAAVVKKWMSAIIAVSPSTRLIIVGTYADFLDGGKVKANSEDMKKHVKTTLESAMAELEDHISQARKRRDQESGASSHGAKDKTRGTCCLSKSGLYVKSLEDMLDELKSAESPDVLSLSCENPSSGDGVDALRRLILRKVKPAFLMKAEWLPFAKQWLEKNTQDSSLFWTMTKAKEIFEGQCGQQSVESLETILGYLANSSYIIWHRNHEQLKGYIFHRTDILLSIFSKLHYDVPTESARIKKQDIAKFSKGHLTDSVLKYLLGDRVQDSEAIKTVMEHFNLICTGCRGQNSIMILPYRLSEKEVPAVRNPSSAYTPRVHIRITFDTWVIPLGFFHASMARLIANINGATPQFWKNGLTYRLDAVTCSYKKLNDVLEIAACSDNDIRLLWKHVHSLVMDVCGHILSDWPGAMPTVQFLCPYWTYDQMHLEETCHGRDVKLDDIVAGQDLAVYTLDCHSCQADVPRALFDICKHELLDDRHLKDVSAFLESLSKQGRPMVTQKEESEDASLSRSSSEPSRRERPMVTEKEESEDASWSWSSGEPSRRGFSHSKFGKSSKKIANPILLSELARRFSKARTILVGKLGRSDVLHILDCLYAENLISQPEKEDVEAEATPTSMTRCLIDMVERRGDDSIEVFLQALASDQVLRRDLADAIRNMELH